jgi:lipid-A-disaccharide synthase-like uncharacterized protein
MTYERLWLGVRLIGQTLFSMRFVVQWIQSERTGGSVVPRAFWYFSIAGGITLMAYAISRSDPVFVLGQAGGLAIYLRNLMLLRSERRSVEAT